MQKVIYNGKIYIENDHFEEAILIDDNMITMIGSNEEVLMSAENAILIDCEGKTVIPGLNDAHLHLLNMALGSAQVQLNHCRSISDLIDSGRFFIKENPELTKDGLGGRGWNQDYFNDQRMPDRHDLDKISTTIPIVLRRVCGHSLVTNTKAITMLGLDHSSEQFEGGTFEVDEYGYPTGIFTEKACEKPLALLPTVDLATIRKLLIKTMEQAVAQGITSVQSNDISDFNEDASLIRLIEDIYQQEEAPLRYRFQVCFNDLNSFENTIKTKAYHLNIDHPWLKLGPLKLYKDGSLGARTALMRNPYKDDLKNYGIEVLSDQEVLAYCKLAEANRIQVFTHVIGDKATASLIDIYQQVITKSNRNRHSLVHLQITDRAQLETIADMQIGVIYQPIFLQYDLHIVDKRIDEKLASTSYAFNTLAELNGKIAYSTDSPVEACNPFYNIYCAVLRQDYNGYPEEGFYPKERVDVAKAIDAYTLGSAYVEFAEKNKGRLLVGYEADLVVLDQDIFTIEAKNIKDIKPLLTMVDGNIVYRKGL